MFGPIVVALVAGQLEITAVPVQAQLSTATRHFGPRAVVGWQLNASLGLQVSGFYNCVAEPSPRSTEEARADAVSPPELNTWGVLTGAEVTPLHGVSNFGRVSVVASASLGLGETRVELKPANAAGPATYGNTGLRLLGMFGGGFRLQPLKHVAVRLEIHDLVFMNRRETINGCTAQELSALSIPFPALPARVSPRCDVRGFGPFDAALANAAMQRQPAGEIAHNVTVQLGAAVLF